MLHVWRRVNIDKYIFLWFYSISYDRFNEIDEHVSWQEVNQFRELFHTGISFSISSLAQNLVLNIYVAQNRVQNSQGMGITKDFHTFLRHRWVGFHCGTPKLSQERDFKMIFFFFAIGLLKNSVNSYQRWNLGLIQKVFRMSWLLKEIQKTNCLFLSGEKGVESTNF